MRAHTITTKPPVGGRAVGRWVHHRGHLHPYKHWAQGGHPEHRTRRPDGDAHRQRGHPCDPAGPALLLRDVEYRSAPYSDKAFLKKKLAFSVRPNYDSSVVVRGGVTRTVAQVAAHKSTWFKAKLKHLRRLKESPTRPTVTIKFTATDEFGQRATDELKVPLCRRNLDTPHCGRWSRRAGATRK